MFKTFSSVYWPNSQYFFWELSISLAVLLIKWFDILVLHCHSYCSEAFGISFFLFSVSSLWLMVFLLPRSFLILWNQICQFLCCWNPETSAHASVLKWFSASSFTMSGLIFSNLCPFWLTFVEGWDEAVVFLFYMWTFSSVCFRSFCWELVALGCRGFLILGTWFCSS